MKKMQTFADKAVQLHKDLTNRSDDLPKGHFEPPTGRLTTAFRFVPVTPKGNIYDKISISTPMDSDGIIETALFKDGHMIDDESLGYGDSIRRFDTVNDLIKELNRLDGTITKSQDDEEDEATQQFQKGLKLPTSQEALREEILSHLKKMNEEEFNAIKEWQTKLLQNQEKITKSLSQVLEEQKKAQHQFDLLFSFKKEQEEKNLKIQHSVEWELKEKIFELEDTVNDLKYELKDKNLEIRKIETAINSLLNK